MKPTSEELELLQCIKRNEIVRRGPVLDGIEAKGWARQLLGGWTVTPLGRRAMTGSAVPGRV